MSMMHGIASIDRFEYIHMCESQQLVTHFVTRDFTYIRLQSVLVRNLKDGGDRMRILLLNYTVIF